MSLRKIKNTISRNIANIPGWTTNRKLIIIESDDWGSIRMPSKGAYSAMLKEGVRVNECPYCSYDSLESEEDLQALFDVLTSVKDSKGNHAVITANAIMANPDFEKIEQSGFKEYHYELFTETYKRYPQHKNSFNLLKEGIQTKIFIPQLHGREHVNVHRWMRALQNGSEETLKAFKLNLFGISTTITNEKRKSYMPAFDFDDESEMAKHTDIVKDAVSIFEQLMGYRSVSFVAPNYTWHNSLEKDLDSAGIKTIQGSKFQMVPQQGAPYKKVKHYTGQKNNLGQIYTSRNCLFEPSEAKTRDWVTNCLNEINIAFRWKKPAIISSHRLNFIGSIAEENRTKNLEMLKVLLNSILKKWPDAEFISSADLAELMTKRS